MYFSEQCNWADMSTVIIIESQSSVKQKMVNMYKPVFVIQSLYMCMRYENFFFEKYFTVKAKDFAAFV
jgi:hypothetical protein